MDISIVIASYPGLLTPVLMLVLVLQATSTGVRRPGHKTSIVTYPYYVDIIVLQLYMQGTVTQG